MKYSFFLLLILFTEPLFAQYPLILSQRDQAAVVDDLLNDRLKGSSSRSYEKRRV